MTRWNPKGMVFEDATEIQAVDEVSVNSLHWDRNGYPVGPVDVAGLEAGDGDVNSSHLVADPA